MNPFAALALLMLAAAAPSAAARISGDVVLRTIGQDRVAVFIDSNADQRIDHGFLLSSDIPIARMSVHLTGATVEYTDAYVRLIGDERLYDLHVAGHPEPPSAPKDLRAVRFIGYALQHSTGDSTCTLIQAHEGDVGACYGYGEK